MHNHTIALADKSQISEPPALRRDNNLTTGKIYESVIKKDTTTVVLEVVIITNYACMK